MTFQLPDLMPLVLVIVAAIVVAAGALFFVAGDFLLSNRKVRVARHESIPAYYGHLVLSR